MISKKMEELIKSSSAIRAMFLEGKKMALQFGAENVYDFSLGNPSVDAPEQIKTLISDILRDEKSTAIHGYMENAGFADARGKIAQATNKEFGTNFAPENVIMTVGAAGAINIVFKTILDPGDEVVVLAPYFAEYRHYVENHGGKLVIAPTGAGFLPNLDMLAQKLSPKTKAVIINSPNNPSGVVYSEQTLRALADVLEAHEKHVGHSVYLISDEPYRKIIYDGAVVPYVSKFYKNTFIAYSFSKSLSLPGERIGYLIAPSEMDGFEGIIGGLSVANRILGFVNAPSLFQKVAAACVDIDADFSVYRNNRDTLYNALTSIGYECAKPEGAFYLLPKALDEDDSNFCSEAKKYNLLVVPGRAFGAPGYFRIAYCVEERVAAGALDKFETLYKQYRG